MFKKEVDDVIMGGKCKKVYESNRSPFYNPKQLEIFPAYLVKAIDFVEFIDKDAKDEVDRYSFVENDEGLWRCIYTLRMWSQTFSINQYPLIVGMNSLSSLLCLIKRLKGGARSSYKGIGQAEQLW